MAGLLGQLKMGLLNLLPTEWMAIKGSEPNTIHLTYDDGPDPDVTPPLLALLKSHGAKATFFLLGKNVEKHPELVRQIVAEGHTLGNHSFYHKAFHKMPVASQLEEIENTNTLLKNITGQTCRLFRAPGGRLSATLFMRLVGLKIRYANWSRDSLDYDRDASGVINGLEKQPIVDGDIVLMHDDNQKVLTITDYILTRYKQHRFIGM